MATKSYTALREATGRDRDEWFRALDEWGAPGRPYKEIAGWLTDEHGMSKWWAQKLIVEYEQERGIRGAGARPDGTFSGGASKTIAVPVDDAYEAIVDADKRAAWLPGVVLNERTSRPGRSARFDWQDGTTRISVDFSAAGPGKCQVAVQHERLPDAPRAADAKAHWRDRLTALKSHLEGR